MLQEKMIIIFFNIKLSKNPIPYPMLHRWSGSLSVTTNANLVAGEGEGSGVLCS